MAIGDNRDNRRFKLIPVRPDCSDATDLLGYRNKFVPGIIIDAAYEAMKKSIITKLKTSFLKEVDSEYRNTSISLVFNMASGYREL